MLSTNKSSEPSNTTKTTTTTTIKGTRTLSNSKKIPDAPSLLSSLPKISNIIPGKVTPSTNSSSTDKNPILDIAKQIGMALVFIIIIIILVSIIKNIYLTMKRNALLNVLLIDGTVNARKKFIQISQDPDNMNYIPIARSSNEDKGIEFTYMFWIFIDDWNYKSGSWKHVMHKGSPNSWPDRCPGVWIAPDKNDMYIYYNTFDKIDNHVIIEGIPLNKWIHVALIAHDINFDVYINGNLKSRDILKSPIKQNYGDIYFNQYNGFSGYLANVQYMASAISYLELSNHINKGISTKACVDTGEAPPYFDKRWYL